MSSTPTPPPAPSYAAATSRQWFAAVVTDVLAPGHLVIVLLVVVGWHSTGSARGAAWGLLAALFCGVVPLAVVHWGVRRGGLTDRHVGVRRQRLVPLSVSLGSAVAGLLSLWTLDAPREVASLVMALLVGLVTCLAVTIHWQVSVHTAVAGGSVMVLIVTYGWVLVPAFAIVALVGWSRRVLGAHTAAQMLCGTALGVATALTYALLR